MCYPKILKQEIIFLNVTKGAFLDYLDYKYLGLEISGSVGQVNKNNNGKGHFILELSNDLVGRL